MAGQIISLMKVIAIVAGAVLIVFLILLSLPNSKLRSYTLEVLAWMTVGGTGLSVLSPIDAIPDFIPVFGQLDDIGAIILGIIAFIFALKQHKERARWKDTPANAGVLPPAR